MPAASPVEIVNRALVLYLGGKPLATFDEPDDPTGPATASVMRLAYPNSRDSLLVACPWGFATRRAALSETDVPVYGFAHAYTLPQGPNPLYCLRVLDTNLDPSWGLWWPWTFTTNLFPWPTVGNQGVWQVEGRTLVTDQPSAVGAPIEIRYIAQITDTSIYPAAFDSALALDIAADSAFALTRDNNTAIRLRKEADDALKAAITVESREGSLMRQVDTTLTEVRW